MKKNIKFTQEQSQLVVEKMSAFKSDIFKKVSVELTQNIGGYVKPFSKTFIQGGWTKSSFSDAKSY